MALIGIDLGTTNSLVSVWKNGTVEIIKNNLGHMMTPSVVSLEEGGNILVGEIAKQRRISHPNHTAFEFKRSMGTRKEYVLAHRRYFAEDLTSFLLKKMIEDAQNALGTEITQAVISVPTYFDDNQREATKRAARIAGIEVKRLVNEPSAAIIYHQWKSQNTGREGHYLVIDFGGGTLDVSVVDCFDNIIGIIAIAGDNKLGGKDFDRHLAEDFCRRFDLIFSKLDKWTKQNLLWIAENVKRKLSHEECVMMRATIKDKEYEAEYTTDELLKVIARLLLRMQSVINDALKGACIEPEQIVDIVLVGGICKMPLVQKYLSALFHRDIVADEECEQLVALGVGVLAGTINGDVQEKTLQKHEEMNPSQKAHKFVRDTKQDEAFIKLVEDAAKNFENRHTDKRDPVQVAKVEYILQHDTRNAKQLKQFEWLLYNEVSAEEWREFFINKDFFERQYEIEFITGMAEIIKSRLLELQRMKMGLMCSGVLIYFCIVYGDIYTKREYFQSDKKIYREDILRGLIQMFTSEVNRGYVHQRIEEDAGLLGEQYAFYLYRNILETLDADIPDKEKIKQLIIDGFQKKDISKVFFELLFYLITSGRKNIAIFQLALKQVCEMKWDSSIQEEIEILKLELNNVEPIVWKRMDVKSNKKKEDKQIGKTQNRQTLEQRRAQKAEEEKVWNRAIGKWTFRFVAFILCINVFCRFVDAQKSMEYVHVMGTVTSVTKEEGRLAGKNTYSYRVWVEYPVGEEKQKSLYKTYSDFDYALYEEVPILYRMDDVDDAYVAKKDWLTGAYLPVGKLYDIPWIIAAYFCITGILFYTNAPLIRKCK